MTPVDAKHKMAKSAHVVYMRNLKKVIESFFNIYETSYSGVFGVVDYESVVRFQNGGSNTLKEMFRLYCQNSGCFSHIVFLKYIERFCHTVRLFQPHEVSVLEMQNVCITFTLLQPITVWLT